MTLDITVTDMFCGAGGSTTGAIQAGARVNLAINHWARAIETHNTNYPEVTHALTDLHMANPRRFPGSTILEGSPECTEHTLAKGRKRTGQGQLELWDTGASDLATAAEERSRCTMWTPLDWAECHNYQAVILENVVDVHLWRPFQAWLQAWRSLDYDFEVVYLNSMHAHPTPQSRDRMYFVAWKRGNRRPNLKITPAAHCGPCAKDVASIQCWKNPTRRYGKYKQQYVYCCPRCAQEVIPYYYAAATAIDWSVPAPRIGARKKPLKEKTQNRIKYGLEKFTRENHPFLLQTSHGVCGHASYVTSASEVPFPTQTTRQDMALCVPSPFILDHLGEYRPRSITRPLSTVCAAGNHHSIILPPQAQAYLMTYYNHGQLLPVHEAAPTVTTLERHALVTTENAAPDIEDCGFRMLIPKEIQAAMAFPENYVVTGTHREQVKQLGNAVTPPVMKLLMERVLASLAGGVSGGLQ
ncbi:DNA cytosine methyltransferase [Dictyobacter arantiisoli]|uniref:DNA (cytosine-5-)-methyltransferase n=1 Tax=Dictyobacter arantiisoli TaxID=2014874 RepID=A0A5A5T8M8_9CHLR|nr:DNA cytosine methyltransferase [Dictyobacter arantiisoli]GCF07329.1 hypothetical protein KDI_08930 [Dictyobacter arantiisoli]